MTPLESGVKPAGRDGRGDGDDHQEEDGQRRGQDEHVYEIQDCLVLQVITENNRSNRNNW